MRQEKYKIKKLRSYGDQLVIIGIDVAKQFHRVRVTDCDRVNIRKPLRIKNNRNGMERLVLEINSLHRSKPEMKVIVGMEPSGYYWKPLRS